MIDVGARTTAGSTVIKVVMASASAASTNEANAARDPAARSMACNRPIMAAVVPMRARAELSSMTTLGARMGKAANTAVKGTLGARRKASMANDDQAAGVITRAKSSPANSATANVA